MRIWKVLFALALSSPLAGSAGAQTVAGTPAGNAITQSNGVFIGGTPAVTPQSSSPNLGNSSTVTTIGRSSISPAMPNPGNPAINSRGIAPAIAPQRGVNTAIGQQGFGGAIGQQGNTAIGQQGSGTAIGEQGVGTAITPPNNGVVIGQSEPFSPPIATNPALGFTTNLSVLGAGVLTNGTRGLTGAAPGAVFPTPGTVTRTPGAVMPGPAARTAPAGRR